MHDHSLANAVLLSLLQSMQAQRLDERKHAERKEDVYGTGQQRSHMRPSHLVDLAELEHLEFQQILHTTGLCTRERMRERIRYAVLHALLFYYTHHRKRTRMRESLTKPSQGTCATANTFLQNIFNNSCPQKIKSMANTLPEKKLD